MYFILFGCVNSEFHESIMPTITVPHEGRKTIREAFSVMVDSPIDSISPYDAPQFSFVLDYETTHRHDVIIGVKSVVKNSLHFSKEPLTEKWRTVCYKVCEQPFQVWIEIFLFLGWLVEINHFIWSIVGGRVSLAFFFSIAWNEQNRLEFELGPVISFFVLITFSLSVHRPPWSFFWPSLISLLILSVSFFKKRTVTSPEEKTTPQEGWRCDQLKL